MAFSCPNHSVVSNAADNQSVMLMTSDVCFIEHMIYFLGFRLWVIWQYGFFRLFAWWFYYTNWVWNLVAKYFTVLKFIQNRIRNTVRIRSPFSSSPSQHFKTARFKIMIQYSWPLRYRYITWNSKKVGWWGCYRCRVYGFVNWSSQRLRKSSGHINGCCILAE